VRARLESKAPGTELLVRHLAIEEEVAGRPLTLGNSATVLVDGPASYRAMFDAIERARDHINCEFYIIDYDATGNRFADALLKKAAAGVAVQLIYDSAGSIDTPPSYFERLRAGGVKVVEFNPINPLKAKRGWRVNNRDHRKLVIVDGRVAFLGGINISGVYSSSSSSPARGGGSAASGGSRGGLGSRMGSAPEGEARNVGWRDTNVRIEGPAVEQLQRLFLDTWSKQGGAALPQRAWFPALKSVGDHPVRILASGPDSEVPAIYVAMVSAIAGAEKSVHLTAAYFVPDKQTVDVLKAAAQRGVDVSLVLPSYTDLGLVFHAGRSHYSDLLAAGVKIYERQEALLHSKTAVIDGVWSTVGSSNMDWRSFLHNEELNAVVLGFEFARQLESVFQRDVAASVRIEPEAWERRPVETRLKEWAARVWEYWL
jgi:cardiolipin synthase